MASRTELANRALDYIAGENLTNLDTETTSESEVVRRHFDSTLAQCLERGLWTFALKRANLGLDTAAPLFGWTHQFSLPSDLLRILQVWGGTSSAVYHYHTSDRFRIEGKKLLTNSSVAKIWYLSNAPINDTTLLTPLFEEFFILKLASRLAYKITNGVDIKNSLNQQAERAYGVAIARESMKSNSTYLGSGAWVEAHNGVVYNDYYSFNFTGLS